MSEYTLSSDKGTANWNKETRQFNFTTARGWSGRGELTYPGDNPDTTLDDLNVHNWAGNTDDGQFNVHFGYVKDPFPFVATIVKIDNGKQVQIFGDVEGLEHPVVRPPVVPEFKAVSLNTNGFKDQAGNIWLKERDAEVYYGPIAPKR
jgi:hypothetical protein